MFWARISAVFVITFGVLAYAWAQSAGGFVAGQTLTAAELNAFATNKLDYPNTVGPITVGPTANTLGQGIVVNQTPGGSSSTLFNYLNAVNVPSDTADVGTNFLFGFGVNQTCCTSSVRGTRSALAGIMNITGTSNVADPSPTYIGAFMGAFASTTTVATNAGIFAGNANAQLTAGTGWSQITGFESDVTVLAGTTVGVRDGFVAALGPNTAVAGTLQDAAFAVYNLNSVTAPWVNGLLFDATGSGRGAPIATSGCIICAKGSFPVATGVDVSSTTISGNAFASTGFTVNGVGNISGNTNKVAALIFTTLPVGVAGITAYITDGKSTNCGDGACTTWGTTVTGGTGALKLLVWFNGTNWTLVGK